ncbi:alpha/beta hydrolase [Paenibacillus sp. EKM202P]|uniref:alpha/beta fold hydrolase n=1 Tax=unclassified Paenibacillus TaxID=185978 RepID=UPI0013E9C892|nr:MULTISPECIES: alpha/beta hydrolase [unclassified Paenibacillus]KAF6560163.1 alpha/beta hydrolase [Paenibacillus sp. EKM202P]KAF6564888.1 alpha/beta hydrolase [Paenibacillus sp. EKM207P]MCV9951657.1 alpha/beta hydrolase [Paenibacillus sp. BT-177]
MELFYEIEGNGVPIVMIHSGGVDSRVWRYMVPELAKSFQIITFDGRGTGHSPAMQEPTSLVEDLRKLLEHLGLDLVTLVGHSIGGQVATDFALSYPSMVERLVVIAPSLTGFAYSQEFTNYMASVNAAAPDISKLVELSLAAPIYRATMASPHRSFLTEMHTHYMTRVFTEWRSFEVLWPEPPSIERLEKIAASMLFIQGTIEWPDMYNIAEHFKRVPAIRFAEIKGADHMLVLTHAEELANNIRQFCHR